MAVEAHARHSAVPLNVQGATLETAVAHLVDAAQGVDENQLELTRLDVEAALVRIAGGAVLLLLGVLLLGGAGVALAMAGYDALPPGMPRLERLLVVAGVAFVVGAVLAAIGVRKMESHGRG